LDSQEHRFGKNAARGKFPTFGFHLVATEFASPTSKLTSTAAPDKSMKPSQPAFKPFGNQFKVSALNLNEAAQLVSCSRRLLEKQIAIGRLKTIRISSRCVRIRPEDLAEFLERNAVAI
jgi:excisionase family DNA binding protein